MRRSIVVIVDGLRRDFLGEANTPNLVRFAARAEQFTNHGSVFPSVTRVAAASLATGCHPARHELAGNSFALMEGGRFVVHDAGVPKFLQHKRHVTGRSLAVSTLAERVRGIGGAIIFGNVSPGATYAHDPDGHGHVYNRAGSFGPTRLPLSAADQLDATPDLAGDRAMTERFAREVVFERRAALGLLWACEPDHTQHAVPLGSPHHLAVLRQVDRHVGVVIDAVDRLRDEGGDDTLLVLGSDHGHQTVADIVDVGAALVEAKLKDGEESDEVVAVSNGTAAFIYVDPSRAGARLPAIGRYLASRSWVGRVFSAEDMDLVGQVPHHRLAFVVAMRSDDESTNAFGVPGLSVLAKPGEGKAQMIGLGYHGGLGRYEQSPFLMIEGRGFSRGAERRSPTSILDIAPTVLVHLGLATDGLDGRPLQHRAEVSSVGGSAHCPQEASVG